MRLLFLEDDANDVDLAVAELRRFGFQLEHERVETLEQLASALDERSWSAIVADYDLGTFTALDALALVRARDREIPFVVVSGQLSDDLAVQAIRAGANDYVTKDRLARLGHSIERELRDVQLREERRAFFAALRRAEDRYQRVFENVPVGIAIGTPDGLLITINERFARILGWPSNELVGRPFSDLPFDGPLPAATGESLERRYFRPDGSLVWISVSATAIHGEDGAVEQLVWLVEDVTVRKEQESDLRSQKAQFEQAQSMARMGSYEMDLITRKRVWSDEVFRIFGFEPGVPDVALLDTRMHPDDLPKMLERRRRVLDHIGPFADEYRVVLPDGETRVLHDRGTFVCDEHGQPLKIVGVVQDITEPRVQEQELERRNVQQTIVANLGQAALSGGPVEALMSAAAEAVTRVLGVPFSNVLQEQHGRFRIVATSGWNELAPAGTELDSDAATQAAFTVANATPVIVPDLARETRFAPSPFLLEHGIGSAVTVPITTARTSPWGVLAALSPAPRSFSSVDVDFLRSVATVLAQALERDRADQQLVFHASQQSALAELSRVALRSVEDAITMASIVAADVLEVEHALFLELDEPAQRLRYRSGQPWGALSEIDFDLAGDSSVAAAARTNEPAFGEADGASGVVTSIAVPVSSGPVKFGALGAFSRRPRAFTERDVEFLQSIANIIADAMDRERARRALAASEQRNREVIEGASEIIFTISNGRFTTLNAAFEQITGWSARQWLGERFRDIVHPGDAAEVDKLFTAVARRQESVKTELRILGFRGEVLLDITSFPKIENGRTTAVYGFARDITDARRAEVERQQLTRSLQLLLESTVEGILTVDLEGRCTMSNGAAAEMLGRAQDAMSGAPLHTLLNIGRDPFDAPAPNDAVLERIVNVIRTGDIRSAAHGVFRRADGTPLPVEYSAAPIVDDGVRVGAVISFSDISERRKLEIKLEQADRLSSLGRLAATIAHEFNNILMGISPFVELIRRGRSVETSLEHLGRAVQRGRRITQDILRFTQPAQPVRTAVHVSDWIENITVEARSLLPVTCGIRSSVERGLHVDGDPNQLQQVFTNLILNARDAMQDGGTLTLEVRREQPNARLPFAIEQPERFAHFIVRDTGCGMSTETRRHIFEPLFTTKKNGTGLGLPVAHQVVQRHGGDIFVESTPGAGTTFHIFLPLAAASAVCPVEVAEEVAEVAAVSGAHRILLVEDDTTVAAGLVTLLELEGLAVQVAGTGEEALRRVEDYDPDVVVLDVGLPDMEGTTVYSILSERHPELPVVFSTGHADKAKLEELLDRPHVAFLLKPYESSALLGAIHDVVA